MQFIVEFSHNYAVLLIEKRELYEEIKDMLFMPELGAAHKAAASIKQQMKINLSKRGWVIDPAVDQDFNLTINAMKERVGLTVQTGNIARAFYDLLKFQAMYMNGKIDACVLIVPTDGAAKALGSNIANFSRVKKELVLFKHIINIPCLVVGIDE